MKQLFLLVGILVFNWSLLCQTNYSSMKEFNEEIFYSKDQLPSPVIKPFYFETNSFIYCNQDYIEKFALLIEEYPNMSIKLTGHCTHNELKKNSLLSNYRVRHIASLLNLMGFEIDKIEVEDLKNNLPKEATGNDIINQRVELIFVD